jgi:hypothetical protein
METNREVVMAGIKRVLFAGMAIVGLTQLVWAEVPDLAEKLSGKEQ